MRRLLVKLFVLDYIFKSNAYLAIAQVMAGITIALLLASVEIGLYSLGINIIFLVIGLLRKKMYASVPRPAVPIMGMAYITAYVGILTSFSWLWFIPMGVFGLFILIAFLYFGIYPAKWDEMDDSQKWQYGLAVKSNQLTEPLNTYSDIDWSEWEQLYKKH